MQIEWEREEDRISGRERRFSTARGHVSLSPRPFLLSVCSFDRARSSASLSPRRPTPLDSLPFFLSPSFPRSFYFPRAAPSGPPLLFFVRRRRMEASFFFPLVGHYSGWNSATSYWVERGREYSRLIGNWARGVLWNVYPRMRYQERLEERLIKFSPSRNFSFLRSCPRHFFGGEKYWRDFGQSCSRSPISRFFQRFFPFDSPFKGGTVL